MTLDTSALAAIMFGEPEAGLFTRLIHGDDRCLISAASVVELSIVIESQLGSDACRECDEFMSRAGIVVEPVTLEQARLARQAFLNFGKGRHAAGLNFGDCFSYALAKQTGEPLLFKGNDFAKTDVLSVRIGETRQ